ncbi:hypothetical protein EON63_00270 [archaeon]|nr:MAG: hypothetical protein EON63_00270 [archaeon]
MCREKLGLPVWEELNEEQQNKLIEMEIYKPEVYEKYVQEQEALLEQQMSKKTKKLKKAMRRRGRAGDDDDEDNEDGYIE